MQPPRPLTILSGASRGLGAALAEQLVQRGAALLTMSRRPDQSLDARAAETGSPVEQWAIDLTDGVSASDRLEAWLGSQQNSFSAVTLINNAALPGKPGPIVDSDAACASSHTWESRRLPRSPGPQACKVSASELSFTSSA